MAASQQQLHDSKVEESYGWTRQKLLDLVEAYRNRPCLYDNTGPGYHNREERARSWVEITEIMGRDEEEVRAKMKSIRTQYARIIQKGQHPKSKTGNTVSSWWLLEALSFLDDFISPRKADSESIKENELDMSQVSQIGRIYPEETCNSMENGDMADACMMYDEMPPEQDMPVHGTPSQGNPINSQAVAPQMDEVTIVRDTSPYQSPYTQQMSPIPVNPPSISTFRSNRLKVRKTPRQLKKLKRDHASMLSPPATAVKNVSSKKLEVENLSSNLLLKTVLAFAERSNHEDDEDAVFGRYIGNEMRSVTDLQAKRIAKMRIQKVLFEAQTGWTETSNEGIYHTPRDGSTTQETFPVGVVCGTNNSRVM